MGPVLPAQRHAAPLAFSREHQIGRFTIGAPFSSQMRAGSQLACDRRERVWRRRGERYAACSIIQHDRFGGGSVTVWGGVSLDGRTNLHVLANGTLSAVRPRDEILRPIVRPYLVQWALGSSWCRRNARPHVARVCRQFLDDEGIDAIDWPSRSPGLNPD